MDCTIEPVDEQPTTKVLCIKGELDASNFQDVIERARQLHESGARKLVVDLAGLDYMASSGLIALYSVAVLMRGEEPPDPEQGWGAFHSMALDSGEGTQKHVKLVGPQPSVERVLTRTGLTRFFDVYSDRKDAIDSF